MQLGPCGFKPSSDVIVIITQPTSVVALIKDGRTGVQNQVVGIVLVDSVGRASVRLFRVCDCDPHGTFGDMNGEYRSPGPAVHAARRSRAPTKLEPGPTTIPSGDQLEWRGMRWNPTLEPRQAFFLIF